MLYVQAGEASGSGDSLRVGLALAGGGPLGGIYELGALVALDECLDGVDLHALDAYVGVSSGAIMAAGLANRFSTADLAHMILEDSAFSHRLTPDVLFRPALREYLRRGMRVPGLLAHAVGRYLRRPLETGVLEAASRLGRAMPTGLFDNESLNTLLGALFSMPGHTNDFRELERHLFLVSVDLDSGNAVVFGDSGMDHVPISRAVQASVSLPGLYPPVEIDGHFYVDGALKKTLHASVALEHGTDLLFCINPLVPFDGKPAADSGHPRNLVRGGLPVVLSQTFRAIIHSRMRVGMAKYRAQFADRDIVLLEPDQDDSTMFFNNVFSYANREQVCQHAYTMTRRDLLARRDELEPVLDRHGIGLRCSVLEDSGRHFTEHLRESAPDEGGNPASTPVTHALSSTLADLRAWIRSTR